MSLATPRSPLVARLAGLALLALGCLLVGCPEKAEQNSAPAERGEIERAEPDEGEEKVKKVARPVPAPAATAPAAAPAAPAADDKKDDKDEGGW